VLTGRGVAWASSSMSTATVSASGLVTGVAPGTATITASSEGKSGTATVTVSGTSGSVTWPNEPAGFIVVEETGWETGTIGNWYRIFTSADKPINVASITGSPIGESRALQIDFPQGHQGGGGTELRYDIPAQSQGNEIYVGYYVQVNSQWQGHNSAINKMVYLHDGGSAFSAMWYEMFGSGANPLDVYVVNQSGSGPAGFHENVNQITFGRGQWHKVEIYQKQGASNNGIVRVWVNGTLAIDRSDVDTRSTPVDNVTISGIWGGVGDTKNQADFMRFDRIRISKR
jgi:polysaccharide lyase-like protein/Big-like domain-containing protein